MSRLSYSRVCKRTGKAAVGGALDYADIECVIGSTEVATPILQIRNRRAELAFSVGRPYDGAGWLDDDADNGRGRAL